jgi:serine/threonine protein kinase
MAANAAAAPFSLPAVPFDPPILSRAVRNIAVHVVDERNILTQENAYLQERTTNPSQAYLKWPMKASIPLNHGGRVVFCQVLLRDWSSAAAHNDVVFIRSDFYVAIKKTRRRPLDEGLHRHATGQGTVVNENAYTEIKVMKDYGNYENIMPCYEALADERYIYNVMLYARDGDLFSHIHHGLGGGYQPRQDIPKIFKQLVHNLQYLQQHRLIHRDLKPENIVRHSHHWTPFLDFAMTVQCAILEDQVIPVTSQGPAGSPSYISPEVYGGEPFHNQNTPFTFAVDVWALGAILWNLLTGLRLYEIPTDASYIVFIRMNGLMDQDFCNTVLDELLEHHGTNADLLPRLQAIQVLEPQERNLLSWLLQENPAQRPNLQEILQHAYLQ